MDSNQGNNKLSLFIAILIVLILFAVAGIGGFLVFKEFTNKSSTQEKTGSTDKAPSKDTNDSGPQTSNTPNIPSAAGCSGVPVISSFSATPQNLSSGETSILSWSVITNADSASIDNGVGIVSLSGGSKAVTPSSTTTYTLEAKCGSASEVKTAVVTVGPAFAVTNAVVSVDPQTFTGSCPKVFNFTGVITVNKAGTVTYRWDKSDGTIGANQKLPFSGASSQTVTTSWSRASSGTAGEKLTITSPNSFSSNQANFTLNCQVVGDFSGSWYHNFGTMNITQTGSSVTGTYVNSLFGSSGTVAGTVAGNTLTGTWSISGGSGPISWTLNGNTFDGNYNGSYKWCGARSGKSFPGGCSFAGSWNTRVGILLPCAMNLTRTNNSISGTYCNGSVTGTLSYASGAAKVNGVWNVSGTTGPFTWYGIGQATKQFNGNYNTTYRWCGWRSDSSEPGTCLR